MNRQGIELKWLLLGMFLGSIGNSFVWPLTTIYMHQQLHESFNCFRNCPFTLFRC